MEKFRCVVSAVAGPEYKAPLPNGEYTFVPTSDVDVLETVDLGTDGESAIAVGGYRVYLPGGYSYWIPKKEFEEAYRRTDVSFGQGAEDFQLIDAKELLRAMKKADEADPDLATCWSRGSIRRIIKGLPTADAVEVVRCEGCVSYEAHPNCRCGYCWHWEYETGESPNTVAGDDYCSYGVRRGGDG